MVDGALAKVSSPLGHIIVRVMVTPTQQRGSLFVPMHWNDHFSARARVGSLIEAVTDPISGQPDFKHYVAQIVPYNPHWYGFILSRQQLKLENPEYWVRSRAKGVWRYHIASDIIAKNWGDSARKLLCSKAKNVNWIEYFDQEAKEYRGARMIGDQLESCVFIGQTAVLPESEWLVSLFQKLKLSKAERASLLSGTDLLQRPDQGRIVCSCFDVGIKTIEAAMRDNDITSVKDIGALLQAGTNCGSCLPELKEILEIHMKMHK